MRDYVLKISLMLMLVLGLFITSVSANTITNPKPQDINKMLTEAAIKHKVPPEVVKAVAEVEPLIFVRCVMQHFWRNLPLLWSNQSQLCH